MKQDQIFNGFAELYYSVLPQYRKITSIKQNTYIHQRFKTECFRSLKWLLKHCGGLVPPNASDKAYRLAKRHKIDLFSLQWKDQPFAELRIRGIRGRNIFIHEHEIPVSQLYNEILAATSKKEIQKILKKQSIVWILREEEKKLSKFKRENDAYEKAGIKKLPNIHGDDWLNKHWDLSRKN